MPQRSKGPRRSITARVPEDVLAEMKKVQAELGISESQLVADVLAKYVGRDDLVRELHQEVLLPRSA